jgi:hypothetical protein
VAESATLFCLAGLAWFLFLVLASVPQVLVLMKRFNLACVSSLPLADTIDAWHPPAARGCGTGVCEAIAAVDFAKGTGSFFFAKVDVLAVSFKARLAWLPWLPWLPWLSSSPPWPPWPPPPAPWLPGSLAPLAPLASLAPLPLLAPLALGFPGSLGSLGPPSWAFLLACFLSGTSSQWIMLDWFRSSAGSGRNGPDAKQGTAHLLSTKASAEDNRQVCL